MNAAHTHTDSTPRPSAAASTIQTHPALLSFDVVSSLSALADGEVQDAELDRLLAEHARGNEALETWHSYQVIGDVLRASAPAVVTKTPQDFLAGIHARLQAEPAQIQPEPLQSVLVPADADAYVVVAGHVRAPAANDALFRWKMVAGLASLAAVMAVSWTLLGTSPSGAGGTGGAGPQLAFVANPLAQEPAAVVVNTSQGPLIRDAQLEALMAEHRQHGGMSALQMPAGFLRNATYDATGR